MKENPYAHMDEGAGRIAYLIAGYIRQTITETEHDELDSWVNASDDNMKLFEDLTDENNLAANLQWMDQVATKQAFEKHKAEGRFEETRSKKRTLLTWTIAASVIIVVGIFSLYKWGAFDSKTSGGDELVNSLKPGGGQVILTINGKSTVDLMAVEAGAVAKDSGTDISKTADGTLQYGVTTNENSPVVPHILETKPGGTFMVRLPDGSKVWLNAKSKLSYPSRFTGNTRQVSLEGEAYFEVAPDKSRPFIVEAEAQTLQVLGTHFNINAYADEPVLTTTLLEGSVKVTGHDQTATLRPGQQSRLSGQDLQLISADTTAAIAWKNHTFRFINTPIEEVMRQVGRWYNAEIVFHGSVQAHFNATVDRSEPIEKLLHYLETSGHFQFKIEGRKIIIMK